MKYKKSLIDKVLKRDLQPNHFRDNGAAGKPSKNTGGKKRQSPGLDKPKQ